MGPVWESNEQGEIEGWNAAKVIDDAEHVEGDPVNVFFVLTPDGA